MTLVRGLLLAAGAGRRMGLPKALKHDPDGTSWLERSVRVLLDGGCSEVTVVLGASGPPPAPLVASALPRTTWVHAEDWADGLGASLARGLGSLEAQAEDAALVHLVDLPDVDAAVVRRVLQAPVQTDTLRRAVYTGRVGHPVLVGRGHWVPLRRGLVGDVGAGPYLRRHRALAVECGDLATGRDVDRPQE